MKVLVAGLTGDDGKTILVVVTPHEAYVNRDNKHVGFLAGGGPLVGAALSEGELVAVLRTYGVLSVAIKGMVEVEPRRLDS